MTDSRDPQKRMRPSIDADWREATRNVLGAATPAVEDPHGQGPPNILYTIGHHPSLLAPFLGFAATLATAGELDRRESELLALRASWNCRSPFERGHHEGYALANGLTEAQIAAIVELLFVVGNYTMLSMFANATRVPIEARLAPLPEEPDKR